MISPSVFHEYWWLDAICPGEWDEVSVSSGSSENVKIRLPYTLKERFGFRIISQPSYCPRFGPIIDLSTNNSSREYEEISSLTKDLVNLLPKFHRFSQNFYPEYNYWMPFIHLGFKESSRVTYRIEKSVSSAVTWGNFHSSIRRIIRKSEKAMYIEESQDFETMLEQYQLTFSRQNLELPTKPAVLERIFNATQSRERSKLFIARDEKEVYGAMFVVWDDRYMYLLLSGGNPENRHLGAQTALTWRAIQSSRELGIGFDFEGSMIEGIERNYRKFGGDFVTFPHITKDIKLLSLANAIR